MLSHSELKRHVSDRLFAPLRQNKVRLFIKEECANPDQEIEAVLCAASLSRDLQRRVSAFITEQTTMLLKRLFESADAGEAWAWRVILDVTGLGEHFRAATARPDDATDASFVSSSFERRLIQNLRELPTLKTSGETRNYSA